jgi:dipeptidyl-peptidase III
MKILPLKLFLIIAMAWPIGCAQEIKKNIQPMDDFVYQTEQFADVRILRYNIPGFDSLNLQQKQLVYYLHEAAQAGRDIIWDQNYKHNLTVRKTLEEIINHYNGNRETPEFQAFLVYAKRVFVSNGIHHHYSTEKIVPDFDEDYFIELVNNSPDGDFPIRSSEYINTLLDLLVRVIFHPEYDAKRVNMDQGIDMAVESANNFYENVAEDEVIAFYQALTNPEDLTPVSHGLNSQLIKRGEILEENVWKVNGMYTQAIERIIHWLEKAISVAENDQQRKVIRTLIEFYETGDLATFDQYSIHWVNDTESAIDFTNGFIEVYGDPFGLKGSYQGMVSIIDEQASVRTRSISDAAQWFEDRLPINDLYRKEKAVGITARAIHLAAAAGDNSPTPPLGVNLPNSEWIRRDHGSKSVTISNIAHAHNMSGIESGVLDEFTFGEEELVRARQFGALASNLHTDLHEIVGHGSGQLKSGVADIGITLKNYASVIEEARADLVGLYFIMDDKMMEINAMPSLEVAKAGYDQYIRNGLLTQLYRIQPDNNLEQAHMKNRQLVASWVFEKGTQENVIERIRSNNKTYFVINDYNRLRELFGELLAEVQRIKSEGDFNAAKELVENYGVKVDQELLREVHERYNTLNYAPYAAFINPLFIPVIQNDRIVDIKVEYPRDFLEQMLYYGESYSTLPPFN